jgi:hypothetical protein
LRYRDIPTLDGEGLPNDETDITEDVIGAHEDRTVG